MPPIRQKTIGDVLFYVFEKSVQVVTPEGHEWVFYGKKVEDRDLRALCRLIDLGGKMRMKLVQGALESTTLFGSRVTPLGTTRECDDDFETPIRGEDCHE